MNGTWCTCYDFEGLPRNTVALFGLIIYWPLFVVGWWKRYLTKRLDSYFDTFLEGRMVMGIGLGCVLAWPLVTKCFHERSISVISWSVLLNTTTLWCDFYSPGRPKWFPLWTLEVISCQLSDFFQHKLAAASFTSCAWYVFIFIYRYRLSISWPFNSLTVAIIPMEWHADEFRRSAVFCQCSRKTDIIYIHVYIYNYIYIYIQIFSAEREGEFDGIQLTMCFYQQAVAPKKH